MGNTKTLKFTDEEIRVLAYRLLKNMGCNYSYAGFNYAIEMIVATYAQGGSTNIFTSGPDCIYNKVATQCNTSVSAVERAVRHLIEKLPDTYNYDIVCDVFGKSAIEKNKNKSVILTNKAFVCGVAVYFLYEKDNIEPPDSFAVKYAVENSLKAGD